MEEPLRAKIARSTGRAVSGKKERCPMCRRTIADCHRTNTSLTTMASNAEKHLLKSFSDEQRRRFEYYKKVIGRLNILRAAHKWQTCK